jgi:hypothetical protein
MTHLFTPRVNSASDDRVRMKLNATDYAKIRRGRWRAVVTDQNTDKHYLVRGAGCGLPRCMCDAVIVSEVTVPKD